MTRCDKSRESGPWPIGRACGIAVLQRVVVDIVAEAIELLVVSDDVLPETVLPNAAFATRPSFWGKGDVVCPVVFAKEPDSKIAADPTFHRVGKSPSPRGRLQTQCRWSGSTTIAIVRNGSSFRTDRRTLPRRRTFSS